MTTSAIRITHPATLFRTSYSRSTFRIAASFRERTDRWFSGPSRRGEQTRGSVTTRGSRAA